MQYFNMSQINVLIEAKETLVTSDMAVYFDQYVEDPTPGSIKLTSEWHRIASLLAVSWYNDSTAGVSVFNEEGDILPAVSLPHASGRATSLAWHSVRRALVIGAQNGELYWWTERDKSLTEMSSPHKSPVTQLMWSAGGSRLISGDQAGNLSGWKMDSATQLMVVFQHQLKDPLTQLVFRNSTSATSSEHRRRGAHLSGSGEDMPGVDSSLGGSVWRPKSSVARYTAARSDVLSLFVGASSGVICHVDESGGCTQVLQADGAIKFLLQHDCRPRLVVVTETMVLGEFQVEVDGSLTEVNKVKLSGSGHLLNLCWAGRGVLAVSTGEAHIRLWNLDLGDNYALRLDEKQFSQHDSVTCLAYSSAKGVLAVGTSIGKIVFYKYVSMDKDEEINWCIQYVATLGGPIKLCRWGTGRDLLVVNTVKDVAILREHRMCTHFNDMMSAVQVAPSQLSIYLHSTSHQLQITSDIQIRGVYVSVDQVVVWSGRRCVVYEIAADSQHARVVGSFESVCEMAALYETSLYTIDQSALLVLTFQGVLKQRFDFDEREGEPVFIDVNSNWLVVGSLHGAVKLFDLSRRELKSVANPKMISEHSTDFGELIQCRVNCKGSRVSCVLAQSDLMPDPKLYVWDVDTDSVGYFNFSSGREDVDDRSRAPPNSATGCPDADSRQLTVIERARLEWAERVSGRFVLDHFWEPQDPRLLVCEARLLPVDVATAKTTALDPAANKHANTEKHAEVLVVSLFSAAEVGCVVQDWFALDPVCHAALVGVSVPYFFLLSKPDTTAASTQDAEADKISRRTMRDFQGLETADAETRQAMLQFSFHISVGNMDEAFKAIKTIKSQTVWENMARMCVKSKRLDVASVCLGNMGFARGARMLKTADAEPELDARVAMLAVLLDMTDEAVQLYEQCGRWDLLNKLLQDSGQMERAVKLAQTRDRIHLRHTYYRCGKTMEARGELQAAIPYYEQSETHRFEVPRMLFDDTIALEQYATHTKDKGVKRWWAQYMESSGDMDSALQYYKQAEDYLSVARIHCYVNDLQQAAKLANKTGDRAACYHLARQYENVDDIKEAIHFFTRAQAYGNAIRLCKENQMEDQMLNLALLAGPRQQLDVARYFENLGRAGVERSIMLYHKAGLLTKATDLAFKHQQFNALQLVAMDLTTGSDPELLQRCATFFMDNGQFDKAVDMFAISKRYVEALDLCVERNIPITEAVAERLTIPKGEGSDADRRRCLLKVAECAYAQNNYHLATKKFTEAGDKVNAMKALMKSGDTKRIIYFAQTSRERDIYIMAANYLQSTEWQHQPETVKSIITFYTKGKAFDLLASFYEACAQVEIDEFHDYEKALRALSEAHKGYSRHGQSTGAAHGRAATLRDRMETIKKFLLIHSSFASGASDSALEQCRDLLAELTSDEAVRRGDVYALIAQQLVAQSRHELAYRTIEQMKTKLPNVQVADHVSGPVLTAIGQWVGMSSSAGGGGDAVAGRRASTAGSGRLGTGRSSIAGDE